MDSRPIGILDSGFGGLSILQAIKRLLPEEALVYFGDNSLAPYGTKEPEMVRERVVKIINLLLKNEAKLVVIACNTATVVGIDYYREKFPKLPIVGVVPVVKKAAEVSKKKHFGILSTTTTNSSVYQKNLIKTFGLNCQIDLIAGDKLVVDIEKGRLEEAVTEASELVKNKDFDTLVLGCTHFVFLKKFIKGNFAVLDSSDAVARQVKRVLENNGSIGEGKLMKIFTSGGQGNFEQVASKLLGEEIKGVKKVNELDLGNVVE